MINFNSNTKLNQIISGDKYSDVILSRLYKISYLSLWRVIKLTLLIKIYFTDASKTPPRYNYQVNPIARDENLNLNLKLRFKFD